MQQQQRQQEGPSPATLLMQRVDMLLAGDSEELRGKAAIAVANLDAEQRGSYLQMPDTLLRDALKQLAQQSGAAAAGGAMGLSEILKEQQQQRHLLETLKEQQQLLLAEQQQLLTEQQQNYQGLPLGDP